MTTTVIAKVLTLNISTLGSLLGSLEADTESVGCCCAMVSSLEPFSGSER